MSHWQHLIYQFEEAEPAQTWQDAIIKNLMAKQTLLPPGVASCHTQAELDAYNQAEADKSKARDQAAKAVAAGFCEYIKTRATKLRAQADTHSTGSEFARMKYSFAASELEKMAEQLKDK